MSEYPYSDYDGVRTYECGDLFVEADGTSSRFQTVRILDGDGTDFVLTPEQARNLARVLLVAAHHAQAEPFKARMRQLSHADPWMCVHGCIDPATVGVPEDKRDLRAHGQWLDNHTCPAET